MAYDVEGDGNCLFRSVLAQLVGVSDFTAPAFRAYVACTALLQAPDMVAAFSVPVEVFGDHVEGGMGSPVYFSVDYLGTDVPEEEVCILLLCCYRLSGNTAYVYT